jgi:hypothetical protein
MMEMVGEMVEGKMEHIVGMVGEMVGLAEEMREMVEETVEGMMEHAVGMADWKMELDVVQEMMECVVGMVEEMMRSTGDMIGMEHVEVV